MHPLEHSSLILKPGCSYLCGLNFKPFQLQNYFKHRKFHKHRKIDTFIMLSLILKILLKLLQIGILDSGSSLFAAGTRAHCCYL